MIINNRTAFAANSDARAQWLHDFNNVLAAIRLQAVLGRIHAENANSDLLDALEEIEKNCERASELLEKMPDKSPTPTPLKSPALRPSCHSRHGCILLMDDNESLQISLYKILSGLGYDVELSSGGVECVNRLRELSANGKKVAVCVLDLKVPGGIGGVETLVRLRSIDPQIKAIASTGFSEGDIVTNYRQYGFQAALSKPFRVQELVDLLDQLIQPSACVA